MVDKPVYETGYSEAGGGSYDDPWTLARKAQLARVISNAKVHYVRVCAECSLPVSFSREDWEPPSAQRVHCDVHGTSARFRVVRRGGGMPERTEHVVDIPQRFDTFHRFKKR